MKLHDFVYFKKIDDRVTQQQIMQLNSNIVSQIAVVQLYGTAVYSA